MPVKRAPTSQDLEIDFEALSEQFGVPERQRLPEGPLPIKRIRHVLSDDDIRRLDELLLQEANVIDGFSTNAPFAISERMALSPRSGTEKPEANAEIVAVDEKQLEEVDALYDKLSEQIFIIRSVQDAASTEMHTMLSQVHASSAQIQLVERVARFGMNSRQLEQWADFAKILQFAIDQTCQFKHLPHFSQYNRLSALLLSKKQTLENMTTKNA
jgi:hypothetical protein